MLLPSSLVSLALTALSLIPPTSAIFADEANDIDYHHELLGLPQPQNTFFYRPRKVEKASLLYTLSDQGILGAVKPGSGALVWRQSLITNSSKPFGEGYLRAVEGERTLITAVEGCISAWDAVSGRVKWNNCFDGAAKDLEIMETAGDEGHKDALVLLENSGKGVVKRLDGDTGNVVWEHMLESVDVPGQVSTNTKNVFTISFHGAKGGYNLKVTTLDPLTGKKLDEHTLASKSDIHDPEDVIFAGSNMAAPIVAWTDKSMKTLKVNILGTKQVQSLSLAAGGGEIKKVVIHAPHLIQSQTHFLVHSQSATSHWAEVYHINIATGIVKEAYHLPELSGKGAFSTSSQDANVYFTRHTGDEMIMVSSTSHGILGRWPLSNKFESGAGSTIHGVSEVVTKAGNTYAVRSAVVSTEDNWEMVRNGERAWRREEGLTGAVAVSWAEIAEEEILAKSLQAEAHSSPFAAYIHRVTRHINDLQYLPGYLQAVPQRFLSSITPGDVKETGDKPLARDSFGFRKLVILATERGRLYALDTGSRGKIVWSQKARDLSDGQKWDVRGFLVNNKMRRAQIISADGGEITFWTATGEISSVVPPGSQPPIQSTALVEAQDGPFLIPIGVGGVPLAFHNDLPPRHDLVVRGDRGEVMGINSVGEGIHAAHIETWTFQPPEGERVLSVTSRPAHDPVALIGRAMSDRSVMYKYLNPNTILITTVSDAASSASFYLVDSTSGAILHSTTQDSVDLTKPITSLITENWFVYSLWADSTTSASSEPTFKGFQLVVSELYESGLANDRGPLGASANYSSLEPSDDPMNDLPLPHVISQAFLVPEAISHMSVTQTRQGITSRQLLCYLSSSHSIIGIPRHLLDPRRPVGRDPTPGEVEEGLLKYNPVIEFDPKLMITHKREVFGIRGIVTTPSLLESTSLVFAYGVDIFGTRMMPSQAFDILGKDFNRLALVTTVTALMAAVSLVAPLVRRKQINLRWQIS